MAKKYLNPIDVKELDSAQVQSGLQTIKTSHQLCGAAVAGQFPLLVIRQPQPRSHWNGVIPFRNIGCFGASMNFIGLFDDGSATLVSVPRTHPAFNQLTGKIKIAFVHGGEVQAAAEFDGELFESIRTDVANHESFFPDDAAHLWEVIAGCFEEIEKYPLRLSSRDRLSIGWVLQCRESLRVMQKLLETLSKCSFAPSNDLPHPARTFVQILLDSGTSPKSLLDKFDDFIGGSFPLMRQVQEHWKVPIETSAIPQESEPEFIYLWKALPESIWDTYLFLPKFTDYGQQVAWVDATNKDVRLLRLEPGKFPAGFLPEDYWQRVPHGNRADWGHLISGGDIYVSRETMENGWGEFAGAADPTQSLECAIQLFDEAVTNKRGTIPNHALVELRFGPFTYIELVEKGSNVFGVLLTEAGEFFEIYIIPKEHFCSFSLVNCIHGDRLGPIESGVILLLAAIIRDFWVVEERENVFASRVASERESRRNSADNRPRIVYLPRVHYQERPDTPHCSDALGLQEKSAHLVSPHRRRLGSGKHASDHQRILATLYGFDLQEGYTFVGPHERGKTKRETIYRSRSALRSLYHESTSLNGQPILWFQFERDVHKLMESLGFDVEHISASRRGDDGVDLYATKGSDFDQVNWIIQCKCWHPRRKVSPNVVRELVGVLAGYPQGTRGMIVATCSFSSGAIESAKAANIRTVDGPEFVALTATATN